MTNERGSSSSCEGLIFLASKPRNYLCKYLLEIFAEIRDLQAREKMGSGTNKRNAHRLREISIQLLSAS